MSETPPQTTSRWRPVPALERRVLGVLVEKAKTTPDTYPLSLNAVCVGCNQKNNRHPVMQVDLDQVEEALERLRQVGAVAVIQGNGRVVKYRHYLKDWLGVEGVELAIMAELLLRGAQTESELRSRADRMERIPDLVALRPLLDSLKAKNLIVPLSPEGRGHVLTHALYEPREMERLRADFARQVGSAPSFEDTGSAAPSNARAAPPEVPAHAVDGLQRELAETRGQIAELRRDLDELQTQMRLAQDQLRLLSEYRPG